MKDEKETKKKIEHRNIIKEIILYSEERYSGSYVIFYR